MPILFAQLNCELLLVADAWFYVRGEHYL